MRRDVTDRTKYLLSLSTPDDAIVSKAKMAAASLNKDGISINSHEAQLVRFFVKNFRCKKMIELGTLTGYSGVNILRALPEDGHLWTFELSEEHANIARDIFKEANFESRVTIKLGKAEELLPEIEVHGPFDGIFIDANKTSYPFYLKWAIDNLRSGGIIIADNTLLRGVVPNVDEESPSKVVSQLRLFNKMMAENELLDSIILPTDEGLSIAIKK